MLDAYDSLSKENRDEKLALLYESNKENLVAVNTAVGLTDRINIPKIVQQGGTWGPCLCSNSVDTIGKKIRDRGRPHTSTRTWSECSHWPWWTTLMPLANVV